MVSLRSGRDEHFVKDFRRIMWNKFKTKSSSVANIWHSSQCRENLKNLKLSLESTLFEFDQHVMYTVLRFLKPVKLNFFL